MEGKEELEERREGVTASSSMELDLSERERVEELERLDKVGGCSRTEAFKSNPLKLDLGMYSALS